MLARQRHGLASGRRENRRLLHILSLKFSSFKLVERMF
jgi:hypothetical protein